jgi:hypothetical protein
LTGIAGRCTAESIDTEDKACHGHGRNRMRDAARHFGTPTNLAVTSSQDDRRQSRDARVSELEPPSAPNQAHFPPRGSEAFVIGQQTLAADEQAPAVARSALLPLLHP